MLIQTPSMEKCAIALNQNAENSVRFIRFGQELIRRAEHEGMDEGMADEIRSYNSQCASQIKAMHEMRQPDQGDARDAPPFHRDLGRPAKTVREFRERH